MGITAAQNAPPILCRFDGTPAPGTSTPSVMWCELVVAPTVIAEGESPGDSIVFNAGPELLNWPSPSLPAAITTTIPALTAISTTGGTKSRGVPALLPQAAPGSSGPVRPGPPMARERASYCACRA